ncbi:hypothetical protein ABK040_009878 [Willaertia magna]
MVQEQQVLKKLRKREKQVSYYESEEEEKPSSDSDGSEKKKTKKKKTVKTKAKPKTRSSSSSPSSSSTSSSSSKNNGQVSNFYQLFNIESEKKKVVNSNDSPLIIEDKHNTSPSSCCSSSTSTFCESVITNNSNNNEIALINNSPFIERKILDNEMIDIAINNNSLDQIQIGQYSLNGFEDYKGLIEKKINNKLLEDKEFVKKHVNNAVGSGSNYKVKEYKDGHYINCDLRYFNLSSLGKFNVILVDPPWRVVQSRPQESMMFSNTNFRLNYNTLSYQEIQDIDVGILCDQGFCFLWVMNSSLQFGLNLLNHWGFTYIDRIVWVKKTKKNEQIFVGTGYYFLHSTEIVLIGVKHGSTKKNGQKLQYISKVSNDVIFSKIGIQSQKPNDLYEIIENMVPGTRKIELFARNHNIRKGWLSLGNRLGPAFDNEMKSYNCTECNVNLFSSSLMGTDKNINRYKYKKDPLINLCKDCFDKCKDKYGSEENFFIFENNCVENIFHDWYSCDVCEQYPICGSRFSCKTCSTDYDVCETCFDYIISEKKHEHDVYCFTAIEFPDPGNSYPVHVNVRCSSCLTSPIIGERFKCSECKDVNLCRKCFFLQKEPKNHKSNHEISLIPEPRQVHEKLNCSACKKKGLQGPIYKCKTCMSFILCNKCHKLHSSNYDSLNIKYTTHKPFHAFYKMK